MNDRGLPEGFADAIYVETDVRVGWPERLRMLVHGKINVRATVFCECEPGRTRAESSASVPVLFPDHLPAGLVATPLPAAVPLCGDPSCPASVADVCAAIGCDRIPPPAVPH